MLEDYSLDTENFSEILERARDMAIRLCPLWTDFNYHDPGITILEMFAWLREGQQYFMDCIGEEHRQKYLEFLGVIREGKKPALAYVEVDTDRDFIMQEGSRLFAGNICFEALRGQGIFKNGITECFHGREELGDWCNREQISGKENIMLPVFGKSPVEGERFYIGLERPVPSGIGISFYLSFAKDNKVRRSPISEPLRHPIMEVKYEYFSNGRWTGIEKVSDDTYGMLQDGILYFCTKGEMEECSVYGRKAYYFRMELTGGEVDVPPVLWGIKLNVLRVVQKNTCVKSEEHKLDWEWDLKCRAISRNFLTAKGENRLYIRRGELYYPVLYHEKYVSEDGAESEFIFDVGEIKGDSVLIVSYSRDLGVKRCIGIGNGFPYQEYELWTADFAAEDIQILVHEIGKGEALRRWERVTDFGSSSPQDCHYTVDTKNGKIVFGDCEHGMAPEGEIILISAAETLGEEGNVKAGKITRFGLPLKKGKVRVNNPDDAAGGKDEESLDAAFNRARELLKYPDTAVTYKDYENRVKNTPGLMIENCKTVATERFASDRGNKNGLTIIVKPAKRYNKGLSGIYRRNILAHLEKYRMLGTFIEVTAPKYVPMELCLDISLKQHYVNAETIVKRTVNNYLLKLSEKFGPHIIHSELYGILDMVDCVKRVNYVGIDIREPKAVRTKDGNILLPKDMVIDISPEGVKYLFSRSED